MPHCLCVEVSGSSLILSLMRHHLAEDTWQVRKHDIPGRKGDIADKGLAMCAAAVTDSPHLYRWNVPLAFHPHNQSCTSVSAVVYYTAELWQWKVQQACFLTLCASQFQISNFQFHCTLYIINSLFFIAFKSRQLIINQRLTFFWQ